MRNDQFPYRDEARIAVNKAHCRKCDTTIESTHRRHMQTCPCGNLSVDGGTAYLRRMWETVEWDELSEYEEDEDD